MAYHMVSIQMPMTSEEKKNDIKGKVKEVIEQVIPKSEVDLTDIKEEIWEDLALLYYKYDDEDQKRAFREVMHNISDKISEEKWELVYKKLYRVSQEEKSI